MLCSRCIIVFSTYLSHLPSHLKSTQYMTHHISLESFDKSVAEGCQVCSMLAESFGYDIRLSRLASLIRLPFQQLQAALRKSMDHPVHFINTEGMTPLQEMNSKNQRPKPPIFTEFQGQLNDDGSCSFVQFMIRTENDRHNQVIKPWRDRERFLLQPCSNITDLVQIHKRPSNTGSGNSLQQVRLWYEDCLQNHAYCNEDPPPSEYCPTRLLDLGVPGEKNEKVVLTDTKTLETSLPYMTLSHCWGTVPLFRHTALTTSKLRLGILLVDLPRTFQDAVQVAKYLGCRYLWIDSLCIVQDDPQDWEIEAALMDKVYTYSICNIAATGASNSLDGLFFDRNPAFASPCVFKFQNTNNIPEPYSIVQQCTRVHSLLDQPLQKRGWVLQERRLARRLIDFSSKEILWQCREREASETFPHGFPDDIIARVEESLLALLKKYSRPESGRIKHAYVFMAWADLIRDYTDRSLTQPGDKLVAIAGIAKQIQDRTNTEYISGLWREALPQQLLWYVPNFGTSDVDVSCPSERPVNYRAPSWSWASIDGRILWGGSLQNNDEEKTIAEVLEVTVTPQSANLPMGSLKAGSIKMRANLWPIQLAWNQEKDKIILKSGETGLETGPELFCCLDVLKIGDLGGRKFFCMPIQYVRNEGYSALLLAGLIIEQIDQDGDKFSRIGYYEDGMKYAKVYYSVKFGKEAEGKREITIV